MRIKETALYFTLLVSRVVLGAIMIAHGWTKVHGGMQHHVQLVQSLGMPGWTAYLSAGAEFGGGILVLIGLFTRVASAAILVNMLVAIFRVTIHNGLVSRAGKTGYEFPLSLAAIALTLLVLGSGPISADWLFRGQKK